MSIQESERLLKAVDETAGEILDLLTVHGTASYKKVHNAKSFMAVTVENIGSYYIWTLFSAAHYWEQNGDLMRDPEMIFIRAKDGRYFPASFRQDPFINQESIYLDPDDGKLKVNRQLQANHAEFANVWLKNIKNQQRL